MTGRIVAESFTLLGASVMVRLLDPASQHDQPICDVCKKRCGLAEIRITRKWARVATHQTFCAWHVPPQYDAEVSITLDYLTHQS